MVKLDSTPQNGVLRCLELVILTSTSHSCFLHWQSDSCWCMSHLCGLPIAHPADRTAGLCPQADDAPVGLHFCGGGRRIANARRVIRASSQWHGSRTQWSFGPLPQASVAALRRSVHHAPPGLHGRGGLPAGRLFQRRQHQSHRLHGPAGPRWARPRPRCRTRGRQSRRAPARWAGAAVMPAGPQRGSLLNCTLPAAACDAVPDGSHGAMPPASADACSSRW